MSVWLVVSSDNKLRGDRVSILNSSRDHFVMNLIRIQEHILLTISVSSVDQHAQALWSLELVQQTNDVVHQKSELLVAIHNVGLLIRAVSEEVDQAICISVEGSELILLHRVGLTWELNLLVDEFSATVAVEAICGLDGRVDKLDVQVLGQLLKHLLHGDCADTVGAVDSNSLTIVLERTVSVCVAKLLKLLEGVQEVFLVASSVSLLCRVHDDEVQLWRRHESVVSELAVHDGETFLDQVAKSFRRLTSVATDEASTFTFGREDVGDTADQ